VASLKAPTEKQTAQIKAEWQQPPISQVLGVRRVSHYRFCERQTKFASLSITSLRAVPVRQGDPGSSRFYLSLGR